MSQDTDQRFQQVLRLEQRFNPSIRAYLKSNAALKSKRAHQRSQEIRRKKKA